jgi:hypothetical protein
MTHPEVDWTLSAIKTNWQAGSYGDIPLERVDRDESQLLDKGVRRLSGDLQDTNFVGATLADRDTTPIGTEYDHKTEAVVGVRILGMHKSEFGKVAPDASLPPTTANDLVPWEELVSEIRKAILRDRTFPDAGNAETDYTDVQIANPTPDAAAYGNFYRYDFDLLFRGYESLP